MFENLTDKLERSFKILKGEGRITEINVAETLKEIRRALIDADVNYKVAKTFTDEVKQKALGQDVLKAVKPGQMMTKIVRDSLAELMGGTATDIRLEGTPAVVLIAGLQGSGKTTFSGKLASFIKSKKGRQVLLVAGDVYRPAAIDQLKVLGGQIGVEVYTEEGNRNPVEIAENAIKYARQKSYNVVIVDTAGRLAVDEAMMQEITAIKAAIKPSETLFVVDAMTGQDAVNTAREFNDRLDFDGVVLTKLDGDTRGGAAISIRSVVDKPLKFISSGEKMDALQVFHPERMADRILGMGDVVSLVERAQEQFDEEEARKLEGIKFLGQGTIYPDIIESGARKTGGKTATIKSHHNLIPFPEGVHFDLIEPLDHFFKDEVRALGLALGLPGHIVFRQPFPGPGLAIRIIGAVDKEKLEILKNADAIVREELDAYNQRLFEQTGERNSEHSCWQYFAVLPDIKSVGVMGDERTYQRPIILRAVESSDAMTADWAKLPYDVLARISGRIVAEVPGANRVCYDITSKPPATIEWE